ncbi:MAG: glycosyltransferase family 2 protein [Bacteroidota bacterium]
MNKGRVSIALTTYNGSTYLPQLLDSIFSQTYDDLEVVASDDCSTDGTVAILKEYQRKCNLSYSINPSRYGFLRNFDRAISLCNGEYIALADQDDIWHPRKLETLVNRIGNSSLICSDCSIIDKDGNPIAPSFQKALQIPIPSSEFQYYGLAFLNFVMGCTTLFRKELKEHALPIPDEALSHDWWLGMCACRLRGVLYLPEPLVSYRQHDTNTGGGRKLWSLQGIVKYIFSQGRREIFHREQQRIKYYIDHHIYDDIDQENYLRDLLSHYCSIVNTPVHIMAFRILFKYRKILLSNIAPLARWKYLLGRLV